MDAVVRRARPITGEFTLPGDKSIGHRALLIAALANGTSELRQFPNSGDLVRTLDCIRSLGVGVGRNETSLVIEGKGLGGLREPEQTLDAGNSGTTARLLSGILSGQTFQSSLTGDQSLRRRPMKRIIDPLSRMGARIDSTPGFTPPLTIHGRFPLKPISYELPVPSAQVKSAVLLAGLFAEGTTTVVETQPSRDHTERMLSLPITEQGGKKIVSVTGGKTPGPIQMNIPGDISSASYLIAAALTVPQSEIVLRNIGLNPTRTRILGVLQNMGGQIHVHERGSELGEPFGDIHVSFSALSGNITITGRDVPLLIDELPLLAVTAALCKAHFQLREARELRHKESDRIALLVRNLRSMGLDVEEYEDGFAFEGKKNVIGARIQTDGDHRVAMAFAVAGLGAHGETVIPDAHSSDISFPGFWDLLSPFITS
ncbi:MAG: 3-phosphoshikimate 1-carboxyvinyltransferase [Ignavibacteriales bacterium]|nr:3-phosphoshikimate 1-carboxyvinyltransferase [Ignavibacteriales bacterium]